MGSEAVEKGDGAAVHAFPVNLSLSVFVTVSFSDSHLLRAALLTQEVFGLCLSLFSIVHLLLTVD